MDFLKKHYEKILLGLVLLGLVVALGYLPFKIGSEKQALEDARQRLINPHVEQLTNLDLTVQKAALTRASVPVVLDLSMTNRLFNPLQWVKTVDGRLIVSDERNVGPKAVVATKVVPLYLKLTLDGVNATPNGEQRYVIGIEKEAAANPTQRPKKQTYCSINTKNDTFTLQQVEGPPDNPKQLILLLGDTGERATISKEQGFRRVDGFMADLRYDPEKKNWTQRRVGDSLSLNGEWYKIVAINQNEIVLSAKSNDKKTTIKLNPTP